jgi:hypothetical protein
VRALNAGEVDHDYDALPADAIEEPAMGTAASPDNPAFSEAWKALFSFVPAGPSAAAFSGLTKAKLQIAKQKGDLYPVWVLDNTKTDIMLANRTSMGRGLPGDRFKWVPYVDMFLFPLNNTTAKRKDPDHRAFIANEEKLLNGYLASAQLKQPPPAFDDYLTFITHALERFKAGGAVALKFEFAYLRDLDISNPQKENAERVYAIYAHSFEPSPEEYKMIQDFLFRYIALEAGRLGLAIHIHSSIGVGSYFRDANANPLALEPLFNDPTLRKTRFVLLHGAWPFTREAAALILKPNVYLDFSGFSYMTYPNQAAKDLRLYLEAAPERVLYGSDASPMSANIGWEETAWVGAHFGRQALGIAITNMLDDGEITPERAKQLVHIVLRENARRLYGL